MESVMRTVKGARGQRWSEADARAVVEEWKRSGCTVSEFCAARGLDVQRLYRWRSVLRERSSTSASATAVFLPVTLRSGTGSDGVRQDVSLSGRVCVHYGEARVEVWDGLSSVMLIELLRQLKTVASCG
jgi:transposase-like protein